MANRYVILDTRTVVRVEGDDARDFLQGLISQDIGKLRAERAIYGAFLTPQGKYLHDFCIAELGGTILIDCEAARADDLVDRLSRYRLRADVALRIAPELIVAVVFGGPPPAGLGNAPGDASVLGNGLLFVDPRHANLGCRAILPRDEADDVLRNTGFEPGEFDDYDALRVAHTVPDGSRDLEIEKTVLLEANFDTLNGIDWDKGCYLGQELTARTRYRGLVKRRLTTIRLEGLPPAPGTPIRLDGKDVGTVHSVAGDHAIATLRIELFETPRPGTLSAGGSIVYPA